MKSEGISLVIVMLYKICTELIRKKETKREAWHLPGKKMHMIRQYKSLLRDCQLTKMFASSR